MDDDWLENDDNVDERAMQMRLVENEQKQRREQQYNQGYKEGIDWANENYMHVNVQEDSIPGSKAAFF